MNASEILQEIAARSMPGLAPASGWWAVLALGLAAAAVLLGPVWRLLRLGVTIVHELGHALVGVLAGRRFTGFVVSPDMSGHTITVGPRTGPGRVLSAFAGYPAPAVLGLVLVLVARMGWAGTALGVIVAGLLVSLVFTRSFSTVLAVLGAALGTGAVWWFGGPEVAAIVTLALGVFLLLGAWRHLAVVARDGGASDDPGQLARLTPLPAGLWIALMGLVILACTVGAALLIRPALPLL